MKAARLVVLGVAIAAGGLAAMLAGGGSDPKPAPEAPQVQAPQINTVDILVAKSDIGMGATLSTSDIGWEAWPPSAASPNFIKKTDKPNAIEELSGSIARTPFVVGEPVREAKLVKAKGSGFMAAILPQGMRAISTEITAETSAGGFILPNDRVDVILTRKDRESGGDGSTSETILANVRVLAIDQNVEEKNGQKVVVGKTATLELAPGQAESLALARQLGTLSLALRSITDSAGDTPRVEDSARRGGINVVRFGVQVTTTPK